jgi:magnesium chelatase family protein
LTPTKKEKRYCSVNDGAERLLETAINKLGLSARAYSSVLKVGHTIADLACTEEIELAYNAEAIRYEG